MKLYGHEIEIGDSVICGMTYGVSAELAVLDIWPSRMYGGRWLELWTFPAAGIPSWPAVIKHVSDLAVLEGTKREPVLQVGTSKSYYAPTLK